MGTQTTVKISDGKASQRRNTAQYTTYQYSVTAGDVSGALSMYSRKRGDYEKLSSKISKAFQRYAKIELIRKNKYPASDPQSKGEVRQMSVEDYLAYFKKAAPLIEDLKTDLSNVKRTPNYEYITSITIVETYEEL